MFNYLLLFENKSVNKIAYDKNVPSRLGNDHLGTELVKFVPQLFGFQAAGDLCHLLAGDAGIGGDERLGTHRRRAPAEVAVSVQRREISQRLLVAGGLLHELLCFNVEKKQAEESDIYSRFYY